MKFLFVSGKQGFCNAMHGWLKRWMFNRDQEFRLKRFWLGCWLLVAIALIVSLIVLNSVLVAAASSHALGAGKGFPSNDQVAPFTADFIVADSAAILILLGTIGIPWVFKRLFHRPSLTPICWTLVGAGALGLLLAGGAMGLNLAGFSAERFLWPWLATGAACWPPFVLTILWGAEILAAAGARWIIVEYPGDVVAYITASYVSKFWELRGQIFQAAMGVSRAVYRALDSSDHGKFQYGKVIMVGHSLGTVISYDVLNALLLEDGFTNNSAKIRDRTRMFLTFGSPLDKTAFLFRSQAEMNSPIREVAAEAAQPMIQSYDFRPQEWVNVWSRSDVISGDLNFYDNCLMGGAANMSGMAPVNGVPATKNARGTFSEYRRIWNQKDPDARTPLVAHIEYWTNKLMPQVLLHAITTNDLWANDPHSHQK